MVRLTGSGTLELRPKRAGSVQEAAVPEAASASKAARSVALDAFRGAIILLMLAVNNVALDTATPVQMTHAAWNQGLHLADLVYPWFLFCVGVSLPFSARSFFQKGHSWFGFIGKVFLRSVILLALGMLIQCSIDRKLELSMGILQGIGCAYLIAAIILTGPKWFRPLFGILFLGGYAYALMNVSFPGGHAGVFEENRNLMHYLDTRYLVKYQVDGLLDTVPAAGLVLFGTMMGDVLGNRNWPELLRFAVVAMSGWVFLLVGDTLSAYVPFNKPVCTPSYLMFAGGSGAMLLAVFYLCADLMHMRKLAWPLAVLGANAIVAYVAPILVKTLILQHWTLVGGNLPLQEAYLHWLKLRYGPFDGGWAYTATYIGVWWLVLAYLYRKRVFVRV